MSRTTSRAAVIGIALLAVVTASAAVVVTADSGGGPADAASTSTAKTITVSGEGTVQGVPDTLVANLSVHSRRSSVQEALDAVAADMRRVTTTLVAKGVQRSDLQTTDLELNPSYDNHGTVDGYDASEALSVRIHPLSHVGAILSAAATSAGSSTEIDGLSFDITDDSALVDQARATAFAQAKAAASQDAQLADEQLGHVVSVKETQQTARSPQPFYDQAFAAAKSAVPISAGKQPVSVTLDVVWSLS